MALLRQVFRTNEPLLIGNDGHAPSTTGPMVTGELEELHQVLRDTGLTADDFDKWLSAWTQTETSAAAYWRTITFAVMKTVAEPIERVFGYEGLVSKLTDSQSALPQAAIEVLQENVTKAFGAFAGVSSSDILNTAWCNAQGFEPRVGMSYRELAGYFAGCLGIERASRQGSVRTAITDVETASSEHLRELASTIDPRIKAPKEIASERAADQATLASPGDMGELPRANVSITCPPACRNPRSA